MVHIEKATDGVIREVLKAFLVLCILFGIMGLIVCVALLFEALIIS